MIRVGDRMSGVMGWYVFDVTVLNVPARLPRWALGGGPPSRYRPGAAYLVLGGMFLSR